jgi:hypothetical protein
VHVAGIAVVPHAYNAYLGFLHIGIRKPNAVKHGLCGRLGFVLRKRSAVFIQCCHSFGTFPLNGCSVSVFQYGLLKKFLSPGTSFSKFP